MLPNLSTLSQNPPVACSGAPGGKPAPKQHPLDPLSAAEISAAAEACQQLAQQQGIAELRFNVITLQEPPKAALVAYEAGSGPCPPRQAFAILQVSATVAGLALGNQQWEGRGGTCNGNTQGTRTSSTCRHGTCRKSWERCPGTPVGVRVVGVPHYVCMHLLTPTAASTNDLCTRPLPA